MEHVLSARMVNLLSFLVVEMHLLDSGVAFLRSIGLILGKHTALHQKYNPWVSRPVHANKQKFSLHSNVIYLLKQMPAVNMMQKVISPVYHA